MMRSVLIAMLASAASANLGKFVHKEKSLVEKRSDFKNVGYSADEENHEVVFAVQQQNLDKLESLLFEVSNPKSSEYGKFLNRQQVANLTSNALATDAVKAFLKEHGASVVKTAPYGEFITAVGPISLWEKLFATTFFSFKQDGKDAINRAMHYSLPMEIAEHVAAVFNTVQFPLEVADKLPMKKKVEGEVGSGSATPAFLNSYYNIDSNTGSMKASQSLYESLGQYYSPADLTQFQNTYNLPKDAVDEVIGGHESDAQCLDDANNCVEANLDVQYIMAVSQKTPTTYWYDESTASFLNWIQDVAAMDSPPLVHSISYGAIETSLPSSIGDAFNTEAMKLGVQGVSILVSSGDDGVANFQARHSPSTCGYTPSFPASSPYVTAVGATMGPESNKDEISCTSDAGGVITTGGGFSTLFKAPSYQTDAISTYFNTLTAAQKPASGYVADGRGYPDVAMAGFNYEVVDGGDTYQVSGTSASAPVVAGMVSLVNSARLDAGKSPLGFLNTAIYQSGDSFSNDITVGENNCCASKVCCDEGFYATKSWDPLTGFGSVDYKKFSSIFANL